MPVNIKSVVGKVDLSRDISGFCSLGREVATFGQAFAQMLAQD